MADMTDPLLARRREAERMERWLLAQDGVLSAKVLEVLRLKPQSAVFLVRINEEKVVVKVFREDGAAARIGEMKAELDHLADVFGDGPSQANRFLGGWPEAGVAVLSHAPGVRLSEKLAATTGAARLRLMAQAGAWLRDYTASRQRVSTFGPRFWMRQMMERPPGPGTGPDDRARLAGLIGSVRAQLGRVQGEPVLQAATHGDYVSINAHYHRGVITGVDIQGECWMAVARDAARFLVFEQVHSSTRPEARWLGLDHAQAEAFLSCGVLPDVEKATTLPIFVAEQLHGRLIDVQGRHVLVENARAAIDAFLEDPR